jgi:hypothetical protein
MNKAFEISTGVDLGEGMFIGLNRQVISLFNDAFVIRRCIQKFPDWPPGARTAIGTALCH